MRSLLIKWCAYGEVKINGKRENKMNGKRIMRRETSSFGGNLSSKAVIISWATVIGPNMKLCFTYCDNSVKLR